MVRVTEQGVHSQYVEHLEFDRNSHHESRIFLCECLLIERVIIYLFLIARVLELCQIGQGA
jgi:hypothetical protein